MTYKEMVTEFMVAMGQPVDASEISELRQQLINEERKEFLKEACDLVYVLIGAGIEGSCVADIIGCCVYQDMDFDGAFEEVHRSNMSKLGLDGKPVLRGDGKVLKGPNYSPADMEPYI